MCMLLIITWYGVRNLKIVLKLVLKPLATKKWPFYLSPLCCSFPVDYTILVFMTTLHSSTLCNLFQAWWGRERHMRGHHLFSSILGNWLAIDDKKNISASFCLTSYLASNWLQKLEAKHCVYYAEVISVLMSVCLYVCVWYLSLIYL